MNFFKPCCQLSLLFVVFLSAETASFSQSTDNLKLTPPPVHGDEFVKFKLAGQFRRISPDGLMFVHKYGDSWIPLPDATKQVVLGDEKFWVFADRLYPQVSGSTKRGWRSTYFRLNSIYYQIEADGRIYAWREPQGRWELLTQSAWRVVIGRRQYWSFAGRLYENNSRPGGVSGGPRPGLFNTKPPLIRINGAKPVVAPKGTF